LYKVVIVVCPIVPIIFQGPNMLEKHHMVQYDGKKT